jgi:flagellar biosynthesis/type III secretory pathway M-ring protein FliF/YscJ
MRHLRTRLNPLTPLPSPGADIETLSVAEVILNETTAAELERSVDMVARPEFANASRQFEVYPLGVYDRRETQEASSLVRQAVAEVETEPSLTNELDKILSDSPADAADILRQWISSTNDGS